MAQFRGIAPVCVATRRRVCLTRLSTGGTLRVEGQTGRRGDTLEVLFYARSQTHTNTHTHTDTRNTNRSALVFYAYRIRSKT